MVQVWLYRPNLAEPVLSGDACNQTEVGTFQDHNTIISGDVTDTETQYMDIYAPVRNCGRKSRCCGEKARCQTSANLFQLAETLGPTSSATSALTSSTSSNTPAATSSGSNTLSGLSTGAKVGIGAGVAVGTILATGVVVLWLRLRRSRSTKYDHNPQRPLQIWLQEFTSKYVNRK